MERKSEFRELASQLLKFFATPYRNKINHNKSGKNGESLLCENCKNKIQ